MKITVVLLCLIIPGLIFAQTDDPKITITDEKDSIKVSVNGQQQAFSHEALARKNLQDGIEQCEKGNYDKAKGYFEVALIYQPDNYQIYYNKGLCAYFHEKYEAALSDFSKALKLNPEDVNSLNQRGIIKMKNRETEAAREDFKAAMEIAPDSPQGYLNMGVSYLESYDFDQGCPYLEKAANHGSEKARQLIGQFCE